MAEWRTIYDRRGNASLFAGEVAVLELDLEQPNGHGGWVNQDLTGRVFVQRIISPDGAVLKSSLGTISGAVVRFAFSGDDTAELLGDVAERSLRYELAEVLDDGRDVINIGAFNIEQGADPDAVLPAPTAIGGPAVRYTIQQGGRGRVITRYVGAPGPPGEGFDGPIAASVVTYDDLETALGVTNVQDALVAIYNMVQDLSRPGNLNFRIAGGAALIPFFV